MRRPSPTPYLTLALVAGLLAALASLAVLQYRWIAKVSDAEQERLKASLDAGAARFGAEFDRELMRVSRWLQPPDGLAETELEGDLVARLARWRATGPEARVVREILVVTRLGRGEVELRRLDEPGGHLVPGSWEGGLDSVRLIFEASGRIPLLDERLPGLIFPVRGTAPNREAVRGNGGALRPPRKDGQARPDDRSTPRDRDSLDRPPRRDSGPDRPRDRRPRRDEGAGRPEDRQRRRGEVLSTAVDPGPARENEIAPSAEAPPARKAEPHRTEEQGPPRHHVVVRLDLEYIGKELFPRMTAREFGERDGLAYAMAVTTVSQPRTVIFTRGIPIAAATARGGDAVQAFFSLPRPGAEAVPGKWTLSAQHPSGSLEDAVSGARRRNLAVSVGILALLTSAVAVLLISTRRAQRFARQQMDFVAGVSHELKTPLTAMRSAGQNLADGIVDSPERVRTYGALIEREGRRLTEMVGRVLTFAGIQSGSQAFQFQAVSVEELVEGVLADCRWVLEERKVQIEKSVAGEMLMVSGDAAALRQALANLVDNALKYGGASKWIGLEVRTAASSEGEEVVVSVVDRGIGIDRSDLPRLFDPFFRSSDPSVAGITGSGLGLAVVRGIVTAHGGRVTVASAPGKGSTFSIHLPVAPAAAGKGGAA